METSLPLDGTQGLGFFPIASPKTMSSCTLYGCKHCTEAAPTSCLECNDGLFFSQTLGICAGSCINPDFAPNAAGVCVLATCSTVTNCKVCDTDPLLCEECIPNFSISHDATQCYPTFVSTHKCPDVNEASLSGSQIQGLDTAASVSSCKLCTQNDPVVTCKFNLI